MSDMNRSAIEEEGLSSVTGGSGDSPARFGAICPACRKPLAGMMYSGWRGVCPNCGAGIYTENGQVFLMNDGK